MLHAQRRASINLARKLRYRNNKRQYTLEKTEDDSFEIIKNSNENLIEASKAKSTPSKSPSSKKSPNQDSKKSKSAKARSNSERNVFFSRKNGRNGGKSHQRKSSKSNSSRPRNLRKGNKTRNLFDYEEDVKKSRDASHRNDAKLNKRNSTSRSTSRNSINRSSTSRNSIGNSSKKWRKKRSSSSVGDTSLERISYLVRRQESMRKKLMNQIDSRSSEPLTGLRSPTKTPGSFSFPSPTRSSRSSSGGINISVPPLTVRAYSTPVSPRLKSPEQRHTSRNLSLTEGPPLLIPDGKSESVLCVNRLLFQSLKKENTELRLENEALLQKIKMLEQQLVRSGLNSKILEVIEHQRLSAGGWSKDSLTSDDPCAWQVIDGKNNDMIDALSARIVLPLQRIPSREWGYTSWKIFVNEARDAEGWEYASDFLGKKWHYEPSSSRVCRRRKWTRRLFDETSRHHISKIEITVERVLTEKIREWEPYVKVVLCNNESEHLIEKCMGKVRRSSPAKEFKWERKDSRLEVCLEVLGAQQIKRLDELKLSFHLYHHVPKAPDVHLATANVGFECINMYGGSNYHDSKRISIRQAQNRRRRRTKGHRRGESISQMLRKHLSGKKVVSETLQKDCETTAVIQEGIEEVHTLHMTRYRQGKVKKNIVLQARVLLRTESYQNLEQFGKDISSPELKRRKLRKYDAPIPTALISLRTAIVKLRGVLTVGIFRRNASTKDLMRLQREINLGRPVLTPGEMPNFVAMAHLIKKFYLELPSPILTEDELKLGEGRGPEAVILSIPEPRKSMFLWLLDMGAVTQKFSSSNRMHTKALGVCIGSVLISHAQDERLSRRIKLACRFFTSALEWRINLAVSPKTPKMVD
mmetsp:Transcript_6164/g.9425  ORF Transcript_6164/g.9425 Transcript_6164/m.9425 type:complete len:866 (-) Transcript_6164:227-2824(-)